MVMQVSELKEEISAIETEVDLSESTSNKNNRSDDVPREISNPGPMKPARRAPSRRGVERNRSGGVGGVRAGGRRAPPGRTQSHKIGRPVFDQNMPQPVRGVNRNTSGRLRSTPNRSRSFGKTTPDRTGSSSSRKKKQNANQVSDDGDSVCDSVFTSASNQTLDSIMLRKKQFTSNDGAQGLRMPKRSTEDADSTATFDFDESLHTVDSINLHHRHVTHEVGDEGDLSVFSESFCSTNTYELSDYDEDGADVREVEFDEEEEEEEETKQEEARET